MVRDALGTDVSTGGESLCTFGQKRSDLNPTLAVVWRAETMTLGSSLPRWRVAAQTLRKDDGFNNYRV